MNGGTRNAETGPSRAKQKALSHLFACLRCLSKPNQPKQGPECDGHQGELGEQGSS